MGYNASKGRGAHHEQVGRGAVRKDASGELGAPGLPAPDADLEGLGRSGVAAPSARRRPAPARGRIEEVAHAVLSRSDEAS